MKKKAVIFDWDGTLFDSMQYKRENAVQLFKRFDFELEKVRQLHVEYSGLPRQRLFERIHLDCSGTALSATIYQEMSDTYTRMNLQSSVTAELFPEVEQTLAVLAKHFKLYVSSSSDPDELKAVVSAKVRTPCFHEILGSRGTFRKGREHVTHIAGKYGLNLNDILFVGDDKQDLVLAEEAGVDALRILRHETPVPAEAIVTLDQLEGRLL